jgi:hypothetical protein
MVLCVIPLDTEDPYKRSIDDDYHVH